MAGQDIHSPVKHTIKTNPEESEVKVSETSVTEIKLGDVICNYLDSVMFDRVNMRRLEVAVDDWVKTQTDHSPDAKRRVMEQLMNARLAIESLYTRVASTY